MSQHRTIACLGTRYRIAGVFRRLGVNYFWGIVNFTAGVTLGGIYVAAILIAHGAAR